MKKIMTLIILGLVFFTGSLFAAKVNLGKEGTQWVWRVEAGTDQSFLLMENGTFIRSEADDKFQVEPQTGADEALYNQLIGQGWTVTDSSANVPQALAGTDAMTSYDLLIAESGVNLILENGNEIRLEN